MDTLCSTDFVEEFMDITEFLAREMQLKMTQYLNVDFENQSFLSDAINNAHDLSNTNDSNERKRTLRQLICMLQGFQDISNEREQIISEMQDLVDEKRQLLDIHRKRITMGDDSNKEMDDDVKTSELKSNDSEPRSRMSSVKRKCTRFKTDRSGRLQNKNKSKYSLPSRQQDIHLKSTPTNRQTKPVSSKKSLQPTCSSKKTKVNSSLKNRKKEGQTKDSDDVGRKSGGSSSRSDNARNSNDPLYCTCNQVSFGEMIACDNENCPIEWFHFTCVNVHSRPKGKWYCPKCRLGDSAKSKRPEA